MYRGIVPAAPQLDTENESYEQYMRQLYYIAEIYVMNDLTNKIVDEYQTFQLRTRTQPYTNEQTIMEVYNSTNRKDSGLRWYYAVGTAAYVLKDFKKTGLDKPDMDGFLRIGDKHPQFLADYVKAGVMHQENILLHRVDSPEQTNKNGLEPC